MKIILWIAFALTVVAQWYVPLSLVIKSEQTIVDGEEFKFKTQPVDPSDPFRGKYITLSFEAANLTLQDTAVHMYEPNETVYVGLGLDSAGYAIVDSLYYEKPGPEVEWIVKARVNSAYADMEGKQSVFISFPFERFYLEESKAPEAERLYWQNNRWNDSTRTSTTYAVVRIRDEHAVLVDVMIDDKSIVDIVREMNKDAE